MYTFHENMMIWAAEQRMNYETMHNLEEEPDKWFTVRVRPWKQGEYPIMFIGQGPTEEEAVNQIIEQIDNKEEIDLDWRARNKGEVGQNHVRAIKAPGRTGGPRGTATGARKQPKV